MADPNWLPPAYLSPSQVSSLTTCGEQYRLERVARVPSRPMWAGVGGSAVHELTEFLDRDQRPVGEKIAAVDGLWAEWFDKCLDDEKEHNPTFDPETDYYRSGRASKAYPNKEGPDWWAANGPAFVKSWLRWLDVSGYTIAEFPDEQGELQPAIEIEVWAHHPVPHAPVVPVRSVIDRVLEQPDGTLRVVDLKTGSHMPAWPLQMALNNMGLRHTYGVDAAYSGFWSARKGAVPEWFDMTPYTDEWLWQQVGHAQQIRDQQLFIAAPNNLCKSACGVAAYCHAVGGRATMTHDERNTDA